MESNEAAMKDRGRRITDTQAPSTFAGALMLIELTKTNRWPREEARRWVDGVERECRVPLDS